MSILDISIDKDFRLFWDITIQWEEVQGSEELERRIVNGIYAGLDEDFETSSSILDGKSYIPIDQLLSKIILNLDEIKEVEQLLCGCRPVRLVRTLATAGEPVNNKRHIACLLLHPAGRPVCAVINLIRR